MKVKLLKKLRNIGRGMVTVYSVTSESGINTGMSIGYDDNAYEGLFELGDTEFDVKEKACKIYLQNNITQIRKRYSKYSKTKRQ